MIRIFLALAASAIALSSTSCFCCTGEPAAAGLRPLPEFREIETTHTVEYTK